MTLNQPSTWGGCTGELLFRDHTAPLAAPAFPWSIRTRPLRTVGARRRGPGRSRAESRQSRADRGGANSTAASAVADRRHCRGSRRRRLCEYIDALSISWKTKAYILKLASPTHGELLYLIVKPWSIQSWHHEKVCDSVTACFIRDNNRAMIGLF